ncbi:MAG: carboxymuconolactone decarboxylase family protein [Sulfitobacter sp.]|jgi:4-carboxymuconolactone decarboxylase|uniref:carboxymuconolactone decarboxylase family protein n=1 Tax=Sulfitobacter sp. TaxID=1903071 RepID=UPI000C0C6BD1|nr:4-carboxymuconolactone decarboxylase [Roseobacter sp.]MBV47796.1 4-carboxymuconolactone decarboxylase [Roseobacter sp.]PHR09213.1 MAG: 4-carboxymuconolactone decarboxylase [Sulfitobacter sp.]|tara:strand:- start:1650 stop:2030 length:381 start_codon:yes stop_codon:yes gene_type:complete
MDKATYDKGMVIRRATLGDAYVDKAIENADEFTKDLQELVTTYCWGEVWGRDGIDRKTRSTINLAMISALNRPHELAAHVRGAVNNGLSHAEIKEILLQVGIYCGVPAMVDSFRIAKTVLDELEAE